MFELKVWAGIIQLVALLTGFGFLPDGLGGFVLAVAVWFLQEELAKQQWQFGFTNTWYFGLGTAALAYLTLTAIVVYGVYTEAITGWYPTIFMVFILKGGIELNRALKMHKVLWKIKG